MLLPKRIQRFRSARRSRRMFFEQLEDRSLLAAMITVTSTADTNARDTVLTLREAILVNNRTLAVSSLSAAEQAQVSGTPTSSDTDTIAFNIPGSGVRTISVSSQLPTVTDPAIIDGYTQPGASPNTNSLQLGPGALGSNAVLLIEISTPTSGGNGLTINADNTTVRGLVISGFGIQVRVSDISPLGHSGIVIEGNYLGTNSAGMAATGTSTIGVHFPPNSSNSRVGGTTPAARNVIAGFSLSGIQMEVTSGMVIQGNFVGVDATGTAAIGRGNYGVRFMTTKGGNLVGGTEPGAGNLISGSDEGFSTSNGPQGAPGGFDRFQGNFVGTDATGTASIPNRYGVRLTGSAGGLVGGADGDDGSLEGVVQARNLISGNEIFGIWLAGSGFTIQGNFIGTDVTGITPLGNGGSGIEGLTSFNNASIGGTAPLAGNTIAFNGLIRGGDGVHVRSGTGNSILGNSLFRNAELGIDLRKSVTDGPPGVTANDTGDADTGTNNLQNFPILSSAISGGMTLSVQYMVPSLISNSAYPLRVEFFKADTDGQEGQTFVGFDMYVADEAGTTKTLSFSPAISISSGSNLVATATDSLGNTSEFSAAMVVTDQNDPPNGSDKTTTIFEDATHTVSLTDFGFADPLDSPPNALAAVRIAGLPTTGVLRVNDTAVAAGQVIPVATITAGSLRYTPPANASGSPLARISFQVQDNGGTANGGIDLDPTPNTLSINVTPVNDAPSGGDVTLTVFEDSMYGFGVGDFRFTDPQDSPPNAFTAVRIKVAPQGLLLDGVQVVTDQLIPVSAIVARQLRYVSPPNQTGPVAARILFEVQDNGGTANGGVDRDPNANAITINTPQVNDPPSGADGEVTTFEDETYFFAAADFSFSDPLDSPPNNLAAVWINSLPLSGQLLLGTAPVTSGQVIPAAALASGLLRYVPEPNIFGEAIASFAFQVADDGGVANGGEFLDPTPNVLTIHVTAINDPPSDNDQNLRIREVPLFFDPPGLLAGHSDPDPGDEVQLISVNGDPANIGTTIELASGALLLIRADGTGFYDPNGVFRHLREGEVALDSFTYEISDLGGATVIATVALTIEGTNDRPEATEDGYFTFEDRPLVVASPGVLANDSDVDGTTLTAQLKTPPAHGQITLRLDGGFTYVPDADFNGSDSFEYSVFDGQSASLSSALVSIVILTENDAPRVSIPPSISALENAPFHVTGSFTDPDEGDSWTATVDFGQGPVPLSIAEDNTFTLSHTFPDDGPRRVVVAVRDGTALVGSAEVLVNVLNVAPQNLSFTGPASGARGEAVTFVSSFTDPGLEDTHSAVIDWGDGTSTTFATGEVTPGVPFSASHTYAAGGVYPVRLRVTDDDGGTALAPPVNITIAANEPGASLRSGVLEITGSERNDNIALTLSGGKIVVNATYGGVTRSQTFAPANVQRIVAALDAGDDALKIDAKIRAALVVDAGAGNDRVTSGGGASIVVGGDGNDLLYGGAGRNVLIGGAGKDQLWGYGGSDLLISGATAYDANQQALGAILAEWASSRAFKARAANLRAATGPVLSGTSITLSAGVTVFDDSEVDSLMGSGDSDWFFANPRRDKLNDKAELQN
jgi:VCBS repeat-containing protein